MADFHFIRPFWLLSFIPLLLVWWGLVRRRDQVRRWQTMIEPHLLKHLLVGEHRKNLLRPINLLLILWLMTVIALAGPTWQKEPSPFLDNEAGLMVLLKVSESMENSDVQPSRLERAKQKIRDLMEIRQGASTGLIVYSGSAHLVMPITRDDRIINMMLEDITPELMPVEGDVLTEALKLADRMVGQSGLPGSLLVIADTVAPGQQTDQNAHEITFPVQFLSMLPDGSSLDQGLLTLAKKLDARVERLSIDQADVQQIAGRAETKQAEIVDPKQGERWKDSGYLLLPLIGLAMLMWFRKGWAL